ncbi:MAG: diaminopimelate epimerase [Candidatus Aminicenantes bacterium]|nr:diaminopimelate epimerase [Candidatus Aminicenantes bacterium]
MKFTKLHSLGNDFLVIDHEDLSLSGDLSQFARQACDRHLGVGADGLIIITIRQVEEGVVHFRIFNADGTEPEISGNGLRCAAASLYYHQKINTPRILFLTSAGERESTLIEASLSRYTIRIDMGTPKLTSRDIPFDDGSYHEKIIDYPLSINRKIYPVTVVSVGNPHCAIFVDRFPARIEWHQLGREIESHPFFPNRVNIEFIRVLNRHEIEVLFWERGVGETLSSGSGSTAAAVASILKGLTDNLVTVRTSMGSVLVEWQGQKVYQTGPAQVVFEGRLINL